MELEIYRRIENIWEIERLEARDNTAHRVRGFHDAGDGDLLRRAGSEKLKRCKTSTVMARYSRLYCWSYILSR